MKQCHMMLGLSYLIRPLTAVQEIVFTVIVNSSKTGVLNLKSMETMETLALFKEVSILDRA